MQPDPVEKHVQVVSLKTTQYDIVSNGPFAYTAQSRYILQRFPNISCRTFANFTDGKIFFVWLLLLSANCYFVKNK